METLRNKFDLTSPRAMVDQLRSEGHMVYINKTSKGTSYRLGTPTYFSSRRFKIYISLLVLENYTEPKIRLF